MTAPASFASFVDVQLADAEDQALTADLVDRAERAAEQVTRLAQQAMRTNRPGIAATLAATALRLRQLHHELTDDVGGQHR
jgi:hypothetical protein